MKITKTGDTGFWPDSSDMQNVYHQHFILSHQCKHCNYYTLHQYITPRPTWVYSRDCQSEAAISGDFPKAARQCRSSALRTGWILHCSIPSITTTGVHWGCSHNASRAFSLWETHTQNIWTIINSYHYRLHHHCHLGKLHFQESGKIKRTFRVQD